MSRNKHKRQKSNYGYHFQDVKHGDDEVLTISNDDDDGGGGGGDTTTNTTTTTTTKPGTMTSSTHQVNTNLHGVSIPSAAHADDLGDDLHHHQVHGGDDPTKDSFYYPYDAYYSQNQLNEENFHDLPLSSSQISDHLTNQYSSNQNSITTNQYSSNQNSITTNQNPSNQNSSTTNQYHPNRSSITTNQQPHNSAQIHLQIQSNNSSNQIHPISSNPNQLTSNNPNQLFSSNPKQLVSNSTNQPLPIHLPSNQTSNNAIQSPSTTHRQQPSPHTSNPRKINSSSNQSLFSHKQNLSISSHFNLFNLQEESSNFDTQHTHRESSSNVPIPITQDPIYHELIDQLNHVDASNINAYLLTIVKSLQSINLPVDDFYNLLYNSDKLMHYNNSKIDKTLVLSNRSNLILNEILNIFKYPNNLANLLPNFHQKQNKLSNVNYHELLRTFLAIKILFDMLVELPSDSANNQNFTIPRLSIYKTYYIICQKLILNYPTSSNTIGEQQKLILGQSKLGKLIKLVYPNLLIKRLGSRGESKYNYLGVVWNENIINQEIKQDCQNYEINDLISIYSDNTHSSLAKSVGSSSNLTSNKTSPKKHHRRLSSKSKIKLESPPKIHIPDTPKQSSEVKNQPQLSIRNDISIPTPKLTFMKSFSKYPQDDSFTNVSNSQDNWFKKISKQLIFENHQIDQEVVHQIFSNENNLLNKNSLFKNLFDLLIKPLNDSSNSTNIDLKLYFIITTEVVPYLLLTKSSLIGLNYLKNLRLNISYLINNFSQEIQILNLEKFKISNSITFVIILKKLININDLLITFIKMISNNNTKSDMTRDIDNFFNSKERVALRHNSEFENQEKESFFTNISSTLAGSDLNDFNFHFKNDILSNDLVYTLIGYNFDPKISSELKTSISMNFINEEMDLMDQFFRKDLLSFLSEPSDNSSKSEKDESSKSSQDPIFSFQESNQLISLINLIDTRLLSSHFKSKYPIIIFNNFINFMSNDILKHIFLKQQQILSPHVQSETSDQYQQNQRNSFGDWWVFNSFIQEYISLMGEIVGLYDSLQDDL